VTCSLETPGWIAMSGFEAVNCVSCTFNGAVPGVTVKACVVCVSAVVGVETVTVPGKTCTVGVLCVVCISGL